MSLRRAKFLRFGALSLVTKLMIFYSLSTLGLLSAIATFLYPTFLKIINQINGTEAADVTAECYEKIIITILLSSLVSIALGYLIARKGLHRISELEDKIENITATSLHDRIHLEEWPKELKSFAEKFNSMLDRLETSFTQLSQFSSDIAHELRTPLHNLRGMTEIALFTQEHTEEYRALLEKYMDEYQHLSKLIDNLLFLARADHGQLHLNQEVIDVRETVLAIFEYYQALADENNITLSCQGNVRISVDRLLFTRTICNLMSNAFKYLTPNGHIRVQMSSDTESVYISVTDTGQGISPQHLAHIFDRFYRVDQARSSPTDGIGLGLAIVQSIVKLHRGTISVQSQLNIGTEFTIQLPTHLHVHDNIVIN